MVIEISGKMRPSKHYCRHPHNAPMKGIDDQVCRNLLREIVTLSQHCPPLSRTPVSLPKSTSLVDAPDGAKSRGGNREYILQYCIYGPR